MRWLSFFGLLLLAWPCSAALNRVYPYSAAANLRVAAYEDSIFTIWKSTTNEFMKFEVDGSTSEFSLSTTTLFAIKQVLINEMIDKDIEQYFVWPSTTCPKDWKGWGLDHINNNPVPVACFQ
jgi:hypothetical protein